LTFVMVLLAGLMAGCGTPTPAPTEIPVEEPAPTEAPPEPTEAPEEPEEPEEPAEEPMEEQSLILATTTSTQDSGLLDHILPAFEEEYGVRVDVVAVGTGQALALGEDGNADVVLVHARAREDAFMEAGHGVRREDVMYNDFVVVGPADDPAGIAGMSDAPAAFAAIAEAETPFVSRGDDSGTHTKEKAIWEKAGVEPSGDWYISAGQGMGAVLTMADEQQAYTLSDRATYLARTQEGIELEIVVEGDPILFNPYGVMAVNPDKGEHIKHDLANQFIDWLIAVPTQEEIAEFGVEQFGTPLFTPDSEPWRESGMAEEGGEMADAALQVTGMVENEMAWAEEEVRAMETIEAESTNKAGETKTYTGVPVNALLEEAGVQEGAATVVYVAEDGYTAEVPLADVQACADCIVSFRNQGGFSIVMPDFPGNLQVKGVVEIQVQ
jgi:tungstate transport system substrate-binding protein